jgi:hypothetical protein
MLEVAENCPLRRAKWDRPDYLRSTILKAASLPKHWPRQRAVIPPPAVAPPPPATPSTEPATAPAAQPVIPLADVRFIGAAHFDELFAGYTYVNDMHRIVGPDGFVMDKPKFDSNERFAKRSYIMDAASTKTDDSAWNAFIQSEVSHGKKVRGVIFEPRLPPGEYVTREGLEYVNTWRPPQIVAAPGDVEPFLQHLRKLFVDWPLLFNYLKFMIQCKGEKAMWWPFLQGVPGNGKSFISDTMEYCIGEYFTQRPTPKNIDSNFNSTLYGCLFLAIEDIKVADDYGAFWETLKPMVTQRRLEIEYKGVDKVAREVCFNAILNSNHKTGIRKEPDDRRIAPFFSRQQKAADLERDGLTEQYFTDLWRWAYGGGWSHVAYYLAHDPIDARFNAKKCPVTSSTAEHIAVSRSPAEQEILEAVRVGLPGFRAGWVNLTRVNNLLESRRNRASIATRRAMVEGLGYQPHPGLPSGQVVTPFSDGTLPVLYVTAGHPTIGMTDPAKIKVAYEAANRS